MPDRDRHSSLGKQQGFYLEVAHQVAFGINLTLQVLALAWFAWPRIQTLVAVAAVDLGKRLESIGDLADAMIRCLETVRDMLALSVRKPLSCTVSHAESARSSELMPVPARCASSCCDSLAALRCP